MPRKRRSAIWLAPLEEFESIVNKSFTVKEVIHKLGMTFSSSHYKTFHARILEEDIDISHFDPLKDRKPSTAKAPLEKMLTENSTYNRHYLKKRLVEEGLLEEKCLLCGCGKEWNGMPLSLQLDHINGVNNDNRIENLRFLCPNCHSQTDTFGSKNKEKVEKPKCKKCSGPVSYAAKNKLCSRCYRVTTRTVERPSREELLILIEELGYVGTGKKFGVSDNAIRKWLKNPS